jgi:hypothetical protein
MTNKSKPGAPPGNTNAQKSDDARQSVLTIRCETKDKAAWVRQSQKQGMKLTDWVIAALSAGYTYADIIHYPECWDTAAYPTLESAVTEVLSMAGCSACDEQDETEKNQIINAINAAIDALTQFEWYCDNLHPCEKIPEDIRERLKQVLKTNKLLSADEYPERG